MSATTMQRWVALTAEDASFVNGAVIAVDGGMTAGGR
jgi:hypothetical protein